MMYSFPKNYQLYKYSEAFKAHSLFTYAKWGLNFSVLNTISWIYFIERTCGPPNSYVFPFLKLVNYLRFFHLKCVQNTLCNITVLDWLFQGSAVVINQDKMVPEKEGLSLHIWGEIIILTVNWTWSKNGSIWKGLLNDLLSNGFSLKIHWLWAFVSPRSRKMN